MLCRPPAPFRKADSDCLLSRRQNPAFSLFGETKCASFSRCRAPSRLLLAPSLYFLWRLLFLWRLILSSYLDCEIKGPAHSSAGGRWHLFTLATGEHLRHAEPLTHFRQLLQPLKGGKRQHSFGAAPAPVPICPAGHIHTRFCPQIEKILQRSNC